MISYLVFSSVCMGLLLLYYRFMLEKETFHQINRGYLIVSLLFSIAIPLIPIRLPGSMLSWFRAVLASETAPHHLLSAFAGVIHPVTKTGSHSMSRVTAPGIGSFRSIGKIILFTYVIVVTVLFFRLTRIIEIIHMKARRSRFHFFEHYPVVLLDEKTIPYTFLNIIFVNKEQYQTGLIDRTVLVHEMTHARQKHTLDILFVELLKIIFWFNPVLYFYKKAILLNHEFIADKAVISTGASISEYQMLLLNEIIATPVNGLTSNFAHSLIKKRFQMMSNTATGRFFSLKLAALLPLFAFLGLLAGCKPAPLNHKTPGDEITVELAGSNMIRLNGKKMNFAGFKKAISHIPENPKADFLLHIRQEATMGMIWDVRNLIAEYNHPTFFESNSPRVVAQIEIFGKNAFKLGGAWVTLPELDNKLVRLLKSKHNLLIHFVTGNDVPPDLIRKIQNLIRENQNGVVRVNYFSI